MHCFLNLCMFIVAYPHSFCKTVATRQHVTPRGRRRLDDRPLCSGLLAQSERRRQCTFPRAPLCPPTSHWLSFNMPVRNSLKTASFRLCATPLVRLVRLQNRLGPLSKPSFRFWFGFPQNCGFGFSFKTDPGLQVFIAHSF